jgi:hypothetical protein
MLFEAVPVQDIHSSLFRHLLEHVFSYMWLKVPANRLTIAPAHTLEKFKRYTAYGFFPSVVRMPKTARHHATQVSPRFEHCNPRPTASRRYRSDNTGGSPTIYNDIRSFWSG